MNQAENKNQNKTSNSTNNKQQDCCSNSTNNQQDCCSNSSSTGYVEPLPESSRPRRDGPGGDDAEE